MSWWSEQYITQIANQLVIKPQEIETVVIGSNVVLRYKDIAIKVIGPQVTQQMQQTSWQYATWLYNANAPIAQPKEIHNFNQTSFQIWQWIRQTREPSLTDAIRALKEFHQAASHYPNKLPTEDSLDRLPDRFNRIKANPNYSLINPDLMQIADSLRQHFMQFKLPADNIALHGDAHLNNLTINNNKFFWIDLDSAMSGHLSYDVAKLSWQNNAMIPYLAKQFNLDGELLLFYCQRLRLPSLIWVFEIYVNNPELHLNKYQRAIAELLQLSQAVSR